MVVFHVFVTSSGHALLFMGICKRVRFCVGSYPSGILAATAGDILGSIGTLADPAKSDVWSLRHLADAFGNHILEGKFVVDEHVFWCQPTPAWCLPESLRASLSNSDVVIMKGESKFRRLLGECDRWDHDLGVQNSIDCALATYWTLGPVCSLRVFKSDFGGNFLGLDSIKNVEGLSSQEESSSHERHGSIAVHVPVHYSPFSS